jgi:integrase
LSPWLTHHLLAPADIRFIGLERLPQRLSNLLSLCDVLQACHQQVGALAMGDVSGAGFREARSSGGGRRLAPLVVGPPKNPKGLAPKTVRSIWNVMKLTFKFGVKWGYLNENPMGEPRVELPARLNQADQTLGAVDRSGILSSARSAGISREAGSGLCRIAWPRVSEIFGLQWQDLDLQNGTVKFRRGFVQGRITPLKTEASRTNLPLPDELMDLLRQWHSITPFNKLDDWIFPRLTRRASVRSGRRNCSRSTPNRWR